MDELLKMSYNDLKKYLMSINKIERDKLLDNSKIKRKLIDSVENKYEFIWLVQEVDDDLIIKLLSGGGIDFFIETNNLSDKLNAILTSSKSYVSELLKIPKFNDIIINNYIYNDFFFSALEPTGAFNLISYMLDNNVDEDIIISCIRRLSDSSQTYLVQNINFPINQINRLIKICKKNSLSYILANDYRITTLSNFKYIELLHIFETTSDIPTNLLYEKELIKYIINITNIKEYRFLIDSIKNYQYSAYIEILRKKYYENELSNFNIENNMLDRFYRCYQEIVALYNSNDEFIQFNEILEKYFFQNEDKYYYYINLTPLFQKGDIEAIKAFLQKESSLYSTNLIIDYHFESLYYNVLIDIKEMCDFCDTYGNILPIEDINLYKNILNMDNLSYEEKMIIHNKMKSDNFIIKFYDDYRICKNKALELIKECMLTEKNIEKYKDESLSEKAGVPIYVLDGDPFFAFMRSIGVSKDTLLSNYIPSKEYTSYSDGGSFSLDSSFKLNTFYDPKLNYNLIFSDFNIDQVVHVFYVDSFSKYIRDNNNNGTNRIYKITTPTELVKKSSSVDEVVVSLKNKRRSDELNNNLKNPKILGIYCYDEITKNDLLSAKDMGIGIVLVKTNKYERYISNEQVDVNSTTSLFNENPEVKYIENLSEDTMIHRR